MMFHSDGRFNFPQCGHTISITTPNDKKKQIILETATSWIKRKLTNKNEVLAKLMMYLCQLRNQELSPEKIVEDFVTFHNKNSGHKDSVDTAFNNISLNID